MPVLSAAQIKEIVEQLKEQANIQREINSGLSGYLESLKRTELLDKTIINNRKILLKLQKELDDAGAAGDANGAYNAKAKLELLREQTFEVIRTNKLLKEQLKSADKLKMTFASIGAGLINSFKQLPKLVDNSFGKLRTYGLFEMDKAIRESALQMGLIGVRANSLTKSIRTSAILTNEWGIDVKELAKLQSVYSDELGRASLLGNEALESVSAMGVATSLGTDGAAKLSAEMDNQGLSAKRTADYMEQTLKDSISMGLNTSKVSKNIANNISLLNKYNFKNGINGLKKMSEIVTKLGVDMNFAAGMADKLFDIEGAVDMSAQLQVLGGEWSKLADPFHLMYMARNDMAGLTEEIGKAAESSVHFNSSLGDFEISSLEMSRLRSVAEQTGLAYEDLATAAKNAAKFSKIKSQLTFGIGGTEEDKKLKEFLVNTASLDEKGKAFIINVNGTKTYLDALDSSGKNALIAQMNAKVSMKEMAIEAQTFEDMITNLINQVKVYMMPIVDGITEVLKPLVDDFFKNKDWKKELKKLGVEIGKFVKLGAEVIGWFGKLALWLGPTGTLATIIGSKLIGEIGSVALWTLNGWSLAKGFLAGTKTGNFLSNLFKGGGGIPPTGTTPIGGLPTAGASFLPYLKNLGKGIIPGAIGGAAGYGLGSGASYLAGNESTTTGDISSFLGGVGGWGAAAALAPESFGLSLLLPLIGSAIGKFGGDYFSQTKNVNKPLNDGLIPGLGKNERSIIQNGKITPIDNKDTLLAMKQNGYIDNNSKKSKENVIKHVFDEIKINGQLMLTTSNGSNIGIDLLKTPEFIRELTKKITVELQVSKSQIQKG